MEGMMTDKTGQSTPHPFTDAQVKELGSGKSSFFDELSRPRALSDEDVIALSKGNLEIQKFPVLPPDSKRSGGFEMAESRPRMLTDKDIEAIRTGKTIDLEKREPIKPQ
jgi:hypothetical protein